jgi:hypothetical protein
MTVERMKLKSRLHPERQVRLQRSGSGTKPAERLARARARRREQIPRVMFHADFAEKPF